MSAPQVRTTLFRIALAIAVVASFYLAITSGHTANIIDVNDKILHFTAFYVLAFLADFAFPRSPYNLRKFLPLLGYGLLIEIVQNFVPRDPSILDFCTDALGLLMYGFSLPLLQRLPLTEWRWSR